MLPKQNLCGPAILWIVATDVSDRIICAKNDREKGWCENHNVRILVYPQACAEIAARRAPLLPPCVPTDLPLQFRKEDLGLQDLLGVERILWAT